MKGHTFGNAVTDDLWKAISDAWDEHKDELNKSMSKASQNNSSSSSPISTNLFTASGDDSIQEYNITVKELMDTWTLQTGYPIVTFVQQNETNIYTIEQQRFLSAYKVKLRPAL